MINEFEKLCESLATTLKQTKILRYPRQIQLSKEFMESLAKEVAKHMKVLDESSEPIRDLPEKFLKALRFELKELTEKKIKTPDKLSQMEMRPRQKWDINPKTRVHQDGKKVGYDRSREKKNWKEEKED